MSKSMTDQELQAIRDRAEAVRGKTLMAVASIEGSTRLAAANQDRVDREALLAEVDRLRGEAILVKAYAEGAMSLLLDTQRDCVEAKQQNAAMREIVEAMASGAVWPDYRWDNYCCLWCPVEAIRVEDMQHSPDCPVTKARAILAEPPATEQAHANKTCRVSVTLLPEVGISAMVFEDSYPANAPLDRVRGEALHAFHLAPLEAEYKWVLRAADGKRVNLADPVYTLINHSVVPNAAFDGTFRLTLSRERKAVILYGVTDPSTGPS